VLRGDFTGCVVFGVDLKSEKMKRFDYSFFLADFFRIPFALAEEIRPHEQSYKIM
jgi:hypothetical protein